MSTSTELLGLLLEGRYQVTGPIARGGMSMVFRGLDTRLDRPVAIKIMDPAFAGDPEFLARFAMEARAIARLSHPGLVSVFDQGRDGELVYLVMELVEGGTVRTLLAERGPMPPAQALSVLEPVLAALATAHRAGLVHRDVKPENVLIGPDGVVKVADFGLVRAMATAAHTSATAENAILGTVAYLAPEQVSRGDADPRSDVYSAGVLLYELLTGSPPHTGDTALEVAYRHVSDDVPVPSRAAPGVPAELDELVRRATRREATQRYNDAGQFLDELLAVRRRLGLRRLRVPTPNVSNPATARGAGAARHTRVLTTLTPRPAPGRAVEARTLPVPPARRRRGTNRRSRLALIVWVSVVVLLATAVGVGAWWLGSGRFTTVPRVAGLQAGPAGQLLGDAELETTVADTYDNAVAPGTVISSDPGDGVRVERGSQVVLAVSLGRPSVPTLAPGTTAPVAEQQLRDAGLTPTRAPARYDDDIAEGSVLSVDPAPGTVLGVGAPVALKLSLGPAPVDVPDVTGRSAGQARGALEDAGLRVGSAAREFDADVAGGDVIRTSPGPGEATVRGTTVDLVVSSALAVPDVTGRRPAEAARTLEEAGLVVSPADADGTGGRVTATEPTAGTRVDPAAARVELVVQETVTVPRLTDGTVEEARTALTALGLEADVNQFLPLGGSQVRSQEPAPGTEVETGSTVRVTAFP